MEKSFITVWLAPVVSHLSNFGSFDPREDFSGAALSVLVLVRWLWSGIVGPNATERTRTTLSIS